MERTLGIIGAGKVGTAVARQALAGGWRVLLAERPENAMQSLIVSSLVPGAQLVDAERLAAESDVVVVAVPFHQVPTVDWAALGGKIVVDATNHWYAVDGEVPALAEHEGPTPALVHTLNPEVRLVRSLNHLGYHDMETDARATGHPDRRAVAVASDDEDARAVVARLVDDLGFEPVETGAQAAGLLEEGGPVFGLRLTAAEMRERLTGS